MTTSSSPAVENPDTRLTLLKATILTAVLTVALFSGYSLFFLSPAYTSLIADNTEQEAVRIGHHIAGVLFTEGKKITRETLPPQFNTNITRIISHFELTKIKVFASDGEIVYSTSASDIGTLNTNDYFHNIVATGKNHTKIVTKDSKSLEGRFVSRDVVETYVPIMDGDLFLGAFELYFDITPIKKKLDKLVDISELLLLFMAATLLIIMFILAEKTTRHIHARQLAEEKIMRQRNELREINNELSMLNEISEVLSASIDLDVLLPRILRTVVDKLQVLRIDDKAGIMIINGEKLELLAHLGHPPEFLEKHRNITIHDCLCGLAARSGELVYSRNSHEDEHHSICYDGMEPHGHVIIPLMSANRTIGVLYMYIPVDFEISRSKKSLLRGIGHHIGIALDNARLYTETKRLSLHDPLTGLANRRAMEGNLMESVNRAQRYKCPLSLAMMDIDYFKKYNDTHGHKAGDHILAKVAGIIREEIRDTDFAARYGGEEFIIIMPETSLDNGYTLLERIRKSVKNKTDVTISSGICEYAEGISGGRLI